MLKSEQINVLIEKLNNLKFLKSDSKLYEKHKKKHNEHLKYIDAINELTNYETNINQIVGEGGNGYAYIVTEKNKDKNRKFVLKLLVKFGEDGYKKNRFLKEIEIIKKCNNKKIKGVINIFNSGELIIKKTEYIYYISELGVSVCDFFYNMKKNDDRKKQIIIYNFLELLKTLLVLHNFKIAHRDIKPENIVYSPQQKRLCFIDFGLCKDFEEELGGITEIYDKNNLGPKFTMAPEMRRTPHLSNPFQADIYSFAKTLWILLTNNKYCFDGQYIVKDENISIRKYLNGLYVHFLEDFLTEATNNNPDKRISLDIGIDKLKSYLFLSSLPYYSGMKGRIIMEEQTDYLLEIVKKTNGLDNVVNVSYLKLENNILNNLIKFCPYITNLNSEIEITKFKSKLEVYKETFIDGNNTKIKITPIKIEFSNVFNVSFIVYFLFDNKKYFLLFSSYSHPLVGFFHKHPLTSRPKDKYYSFIFKKILNSTFLFSCFNFVIKNLTFLQKINK